MSTRRNLGQLFWKEPMFKIGDSIRVKGGSDTYGKVISCDGQWVAFRYYRGNQKYDTAFHPVGDVELVRDRDTPDESVIENKTTGPR